MASAYRRKNPWLDYVPPARGGTENLELIPVFGPKAWSAASTCQDVHPHGPIPEGSRCCCAYCHVSGVDHRVGNHTKPDDGLLREGWDVAEPTRYVPPPPIKGKQLRGGTGR